MRAKASLRRAIVAEEGLRAASDSQPTACVASTCDATILAQREGSAGAALRGPACSLGNLVCPSLNDLFVRLSTWFLAALAVGAAALFASDRITLQGERTIYTVECHAGVWHGTHCDGMLAAAERFRFRALKAHREVLFWTVAATEPSGKFSDCDIEDGRNWQCKPNVDAKSTITLQMSKGDAVADVTGHARPFHAVDKWEWLLLKWGLHVGQDAEE